MNYNEEVIWIREKDREKCCLKGTVNRTGSSTCSTGLAPEYPKTQIKPKPLKLEPQITSGTNPHMYYLIPP